MRYKSPMFGLFSKKKKPAKKAAKANSAPEKKSAQPTKAVSVKPPKGDEKSSLKAAIAAMEQTGQSPPAEPPVSAKAQLDRAKSRLDQRAALPADRQKLIEQALAIQKTQSKLLDQLPAETRDRLRTLAIKTFVVDPAQQDKKKLN